MKRAVVRLPNEILERLDRVAAELRAAHPEESYSRASVVRALIFGGLALAETKDGLRHLLRPAARSAPGQGTRPSPSPRASPGGSSASAAGSSAPAERAP